MKVCWTAVLIVVSLGSTASVAADRAMVPVLRNNPGCDYVRLGHVEAQAGSRESELRRPRYVAAFGYRHAFAELAEAAAAKGGNAVVLRWHRPTHFNSVSGRSARPIHVELGGAVVRIKGAPAQCALEIVGADEFFHQHYRQREPLEWPASRPGA